MRNLDWLFDTNTDFHDSVCEACTAWLGNTSANFADAWLRETHREDCVESDYEDLRGQHSESRTIADMSEKDGDCVQHESGMSEVDTREKLEAEAFAVAGMSTTLNRFNEFTKLLDRQAAITERECEEEFTELYRSKADVQSEYWEDELAKRDNGIERLKRRSDELEEELRQVKRKYSEKLADARTLPSVERVRELEDALRVVAAERDELKAEQLSWPTMLQHKEACSERDAYRELCGRFRKMAQEMANMEVD